MQISLRYLLYFDLDLQTRPSKGPKKYVFLVNLAQIRSAVPVPDVFHTQTKNTDWRGQKQNLPQFTACSKYAYRTNVRFKKITYVAYGALCG